MAEHTKDEINAKMKEMGWRYDLDTLDHTCTTCATPANIHGEVGRYNEEEKARCHAHQEITRLEGEKWLAERRADPDYVQLTRDQVLEQLRRR